MITFKPSSVALNDSEDKEVFRNIVRGGLSDRHLANFVVLASMVRSSFRCFIQAMFVPFRTRYIAGIASFSPDAL